MEPELKHAVMTAYKYRHNHAESTTFVILTFIELTFIEWLFEHMITIDTTYGVLYVLYAAHMNVDHTSI